MPDELQEQIAENARAPRRVRGDEGEVEEHPLKEQIEADRYLAAREATRNKRRGLRFTKLKPPGAA